MKKLIVLIYLIVFSQAIIFAQVGINEDNSAPDASAMLDVKSVDKGMLVPRMATDQRNSISNPATGLLVFDNDEESFWYYDGSSWLDLSAVDDADADPTNEIELPLGGAAGQFLQLDGNIDPSWATVSDDDNQTIDVLSLSGNTLEISLQDDGEATKTIDLSGISPATLADLDNDTKIQVEKNADDDKIRFDIGGTEYYRMEAGKLRLPNSGISVIIGNNAGDNDDLSNNENIYMGYFAGNKNVSSAGNIGIGRAAQEKHVSGNFTTVVGNYALQKHESGVNNVSMGAYSMNNCITGADNTALGTGALRYDTLGSNNVAVGSFSLYNGQNLSNNTSVGNYSGYNATGDGNVFLGRNAGRSATENNALYIDNSNTSSPLIYGEFDNDILRVNGTLNSTGEISGNTNLDIAANGLIGNMSLGSESTDQGTSNNAGLGYTTTPWVYTNAIEAQGERGSSSTLITIGDDGTYGTADEIHLVTNGNSQMRILSDGKVGIDKDPDSDLHIRQSQQSITNGTGGIKFEESGNTADYWRIYHSGIFFSFNIQGDRVAYVNNTTGAWTQDSDLRLKKNVSNMNSTLNKLMQLRPVSYHYNKQDNSDKKSLGFIAQETLPLFPEMVVAGEDGNLGMTYSTAGVIAIKAIQEQQLIIDQQNQKIEELEKKNQNFVERLAQIEEMLKN